MGESMVEWLEKAISQVETDAPLRHNLWCGHVPAEGHYGVDPCDCGVPEALARRCLADRQIVALYKDVSSASGSELHADAWEAMKLVLFHLAIGYGYSADPTTKAG